MTQQEIPYRLHIVVNSPVKFLECCGRYLATTDVPRERIHLLCRSKQGFDLLNREKEDTYIEPVQTHICDDPEKMHIGNTAYLDEGCTGLVCNTGAGPDKVVGLHAVLQNAFFYLNAYGDTCFAIFDTDDVTKLRPRLLNKPDLADTTLCGSSKSYADAKGGKHVVNGFIMSE